MNPYQSIPFHVIRRWSSSVTDGFKWSFFARTDEVSTIPLPVGINRACIRSTKMARVEVVLLVSDGPVAVRRLVQLATLADATEARQLVDRLNEAYDQDGTAFRIERVASGYRLLTRPEFAFWLGKLHHRKADLKLSPTALESLAIIAYRQPITRAEIESIRRVQCSDILRQLMERGLVRIGGEDTSLGRPFLYETTRQFLELFGLRDLNDLPQAETLRKPRPASQLTLISTETDEENPTSAA
ncbi:MAG: SMC-Scp complex subunit ScpB [Planctomycetes bacterium]|nr:SMC-Scp complex subunit ScpB [Planctomycetota bacterium]